MKKKYQNLTKIPIDPSVKFGKNVRVGHHVVIDKDCNIGNDIIICHNVVIKTDVNIGNDSVIGHGCVIEDNVSIGKHVTIQPQSYITTFTLIEDYCFLGIGVKCLNTYHISHCRKSGPKRSGVTIAFGCRIGSGAILMPGIQLGRECEISAGSIVTKSCEAFKTYMGAPAKYKRDVLENERM